jgi:hypothetical protein
MALNVKREVAQMERMTVSELRDKFAEVCGESTNGRNKQWLIKRITWRMQANKYGGLSERSLRRAAEIAIFADLRLTAPRGGTKAAIAPMPAAPLPSSRSERLLDVFATGRHRGRLSVAWISLILLRVSQQYVAVWHVHHVAGARRAVHSLRHLQARGRSSDSGCHGRHHSAANRFGIPRLRDLTLAIRMARGEISNESASLISSSAVTCLIQPF